MAALALLLDASTPAAGEAGTRYENERCGLSLVLPPGWTAEEVKAPFSPTPCALGLRPANWKKLTRRAACHAEDHAIYLSVYPGTLEKLEERGLVKKDGAWLIDGRAGTQNEGEAFKHAAGRAVRGSSEVGCYGSGPEGHYEGMAETDVAYVEAGHQVFEFVADVNLSLRPRSPFNSIVRSLRIKPR